MLRRMANWLEHHWVAPAYSGWLLVGLTIFFFIAATNTLTGWLYVLSGIGLALLVLAAFTAGRSLQGIKVHRPPIHPTSVSDQVAVELILENLSPQPRTLLQVEDVPPPALGRSVSRSIETLPPKSQQSWIYYLPTRQRGVYRWQTVFLRSGAPLGLFWCRRSRQVKAVAVVYPTVLPLTQCPLVDEMGRDASLQFNSDRHPQMATEGMTRSLRPYRWGDPTRLIHWRTSARYGELRVRELELFNGGQELIVCLDSAAFWSSHTDDPTADAFEQAVTTAASLYFYACHRSMSVRLWTAGTGLLKGNQAVLEVLAAVQPGETTHAQERPSSPLVWLTQNPASLAMLPVGSRWILWSSAGAIAATSNLQPNLVERRCPGLIITPQQTLQAQLQSPLVMR